MTTDRRRPSLDRFIDAVQVAIQHVPDLTSTASMDRFQRAVLVARVITLADNPLAGPGACGPLDRFTEAEADRARRDVPDETDPGDKSARVAASEDAIYFAGLCIGLILADHV